MCLTILRNGYNKDTELYFYRNRYYNPANGRFLTKDIEPIKEDPTIRGLTSYTGGEKPFQIELRKGVLHRNDNI